MTSEEDDDPNDTEVMIKRCLEKHGIEWTPELVDDLYEIMSNLADAASSAQAYADAYA